MVTSARSGATAGSGWAWATILQRSSSRATAAGRLPKGLGDLSQSLCSPVESLMPNQRRGKTSAFSGAQRA